MISDVCKLHYRHFQYLEHVQIDLRHPKTHTTAEGSLLKFIKNEWHPFSCESSLLEVFLMQYFHQKFGVKMGYLHTYLPKEHIIKDLFCIAFFLTIIMVETYIILAF